jgi:hypothetical protein
LLYCQSSLVGLHNNVISANHLIAQSLFLLTFLTFHYHSITLKEIPGTISLEPQAPSL